MITFVASSNLSFMIVVTGAAGFIGSCLVKELNQAGMHDIIVVDDFSRQDKEHNLMGKKILDMVVRDVFPGWLEEHGQNVDFLLHIGARTDTTEFDRAVFDRLNLNYSKALWQLAANHGIPMIYASSAATYGSGELGYRDDHELVASLKPLNPYGESKNEFDKWVLLQHETPPWWAGLKFFNVFGPNEYHKGRMASVVFHSYHNIRSTGTARLFRSHRPEYRDGEQLRDFIYVRDVTSVILYLMKNKPESGIYNLGSGKARTFLDLALATFAAMKLQPEIVFIDIPGDIRDKYQYYTEADMGKLRKAGYQRAFTSLEESIGDYVVNYLGGPKYY